MNMLFKHLQFEQKFVLIKMVLRGRKKCRDLGKFVEDVGGLGE